MRVGERFFRGAAFSDNLGKCANNISNCKGATLLWFKK